ncbi:MAG: carboxymuconolactone decarboxylase family protein [Caulobacterales bacterium]|nr:carboxymuconolactone decarboxylase family protein [Caulobacterales bacterium]
MTDFPLHTIETAPAASKPLLEKSKAQFGMIPNLHAVMADAPALLGAYQDMSKRVGETGFTPTERTVVWMTINLYHECHYCVPAHTAIAHSEKVAPEIITALRAQTPLADPKLEALRQFTLAVLDKRGRVTAGDQAAFLGAGYERAAIADVVVIAAHKTLSNYFNHIVGTPVDAPFAKFINDPLGAKQPA